MKEKKKKELYRTAIVLIQRSCVLKHCAAFLNPHFPNELCNSSSFLDVKVLRTTSATASTSKKEESLFFHLLRGSVKQLLRQHGQLGWRGKEREYRFINPTKHHFKNRINSAELKLDTYLMSDLLLVMSVPVVSYRTK